MNGTIFQLFKRNGLNTDVYNEKFDSYEEAYDKMVELRNTEKNPTRWGIQRVSFSEYNGTVNTMIQPCWS